jgi:hypothetical protein
MAGISSAPITDEHRLLALFHQMNQLLLFCAEGIKFSKKSSKTLAGIELLFFVWVSLLSLVALFIFGQCLYAKNATPVV